MGGALRAIDLVDYCHYMVPMNALPPVPALWGDGWRDEWLARIAEHEPWLLRWMDEQLDGPYWRHGSVRPDYARIECPTMIVAGWADGYRNNTLRTFEHLRCEKELLIGPWSHIVAVVVAARTAHRPRAGDDHLLRQVVARRPTRTSATDPGVRASRHQAGTGPRTSRPANGGTKTSGRRYG